MAKLKHFYDGKWKQLAPSLKEFEAVGLGEGGTTAPTEGHVDDIFRGGIYFIPSGFPGNPFGPFPSQLLVLPGMKDGERHDNIKAKQIYYSLVNDMILTRQYVSGSWTEWKITAAHIVETGSNANGEYLRFSDGTQMCYGEQKLSVSTYLSRGALYFGQRVITMPAEFIKNASMSVSASGTEVISTVAILVYENALLDFWSYKNLNDEEIFVFFIAIGRWK